MAVISVNIALARMEQTVKDSKPVTFSVEFIKEDGSLRKMKAQKHVKFQGLEGAEGKEGKLKYNLKNKNAILLFDVIKQEYRTVKIDSITRFNNMEVIH